MYFNFMAAVTICSDFGTPPKMKSVTVSTFICHEAMGPDAMILVFCASETGLVLGVGEGLQGPRRPVQEQHLPGPLLRRPSVFPSQDLHVPFLLSNPRNDCLDTPLLKRNPLGPCGLRWVQGGWATAVGCQLYRCVDRDSQD